MAPFKNIVFTAVICTSTMVLHGCGNNKPKSNPNDPVDRPPPAGDSFWNRHRRNKPGDPIGPDDADPLRPNNNSRSVSSPVDLSGYQSFKEYASVVHKFSNRLDSLEEVGSGGFGKVYQAKVICQEFTEYQSNLVAVKTAKSTTAQRKREAKHEVDVMAKMNKSPHFVHLFSPLSPFLWGRSTRR